MFFKKWFKTETPENSQNTNIASILEKSNLNSMNENQILSLLKDLESKNENMVDVNMHEGEYLNIKGTESDIICIDYYYEIDGVLFMLSKYEDGILLLKNKNDHKDENQDIDYVEIFKQII